MGKILYANSNRLYKEIRDAKNNEHECLISIMKNNIPELNKVELDKILLNIYLKGSELSSLTNVLFEQLNFSKEDFESKLGFSILNPNGKVDCNRLMADIYTKVYQNIKENEERLDYDSINKELTKTLVNAPDSVLNKYLNLHGSDFILNFKRIKEPYGNYYYVFSDYLSMLISQGYSVIISIPKNSTISCYNYNNDIFDIQRLSDCSMEFLGISPSNDLLVFFEGKAYSINHEDYNKIKFQTIKKEPYQKEDKKTYIKNDKNY